MRLHAALTRTEVVGVGNNRAFLHRLLGHPAFAGAELDTGFIERHRATLLPQPLPADRHWLGLAALALLGRAATSAAQILDPLDPFSPWGGADFWSNTPAGPRTAAARPEEEAGSGFLLHLRDGDEKLSLRAWRQGPGAVRLRLADGTLLDVAGRLADDGQLDGSIDGVPAMARAIFTGDRLTVFCNGEERSFGLWDPRDGVAGVENQGDRILSPMPGSVIAVQVKVGDHVAQGMSLLIVEAMKMEHTIRAPRDGIVATLPFAKGDLVTEGVELVVLEAAT
jgi:3-methylcrotonyl-CoA carboxylase alpha subunit